MLGLPCSSAGATGAGIPTFPGAAFVPGHSAPDPGVLAGLHGPVQAGFNDLATTADDFCLCDLEKRWVGVPDRKEQLGVFVETGCSVAPRHSDRTPRTEVMRLVIVPVSSACASFDITVLLRCRCGLTGVIVQQSSQRMRMVVTNRSWARVQKRFSEECTT